jgi:hypothetical protein
MKHKLNETERGKSKYSGKNLSHCHFVHHKSHITDPGSNTGLRGERPATNRLSHGTAYGFGCFITECGKECPVLTVLDLTVRTVEHVSRMSVCVCVFFFRFSYVDLNVFCAAVT